MWTIVLRGVPWAVFATLIALASVLAASPAFAVANFGGTGSGGLADLTICEPQMIWDRENSVCVEARKGALPDEAVTDYALALIEAERFEEALATLDLREGPDDAKALNYRGFATRKLGRLDESIGHYLKAVSLAPRYVEAREYLGEAYLSNGQLDRAEQQLTIIETLCGTSCEAYLGLAEAIAASRNQ
jgi:tetratricopeptide (TPR) repeat protein